MTKVLGIPGSDSTKIHWQGILGTISNGITRIGNQLPLPSNVVNEQRQLQHDKQHWTGERGQTDKFPDSYCKSGKVCLDFFQGLELAIEAHGERDIIKKILM